MDDASRENAPTRLLICWPETSEAIRSEKRRLRPPVTVIDNGVFPRHPLVTVLLQSGKA